MIRGATHKRRRPQNTRFGGGNITASLTKRKAKAGITAEELHGEFGYDTCNQEEKLEVLAEMIQNGDFDNLGKL